MKEQLSKFLQQISKLGGDIRPLVFEKPAEHDTIIEIEQKLGYELPADFKNVLLNLSSHCEFKWFLPDNFQLPSELKGIFCGELSWSTGTIIPINQSKDEWVKEVFPDPENEYDQTWHHKFAFQEIANGDYLSIDLVPSSYGKIVYLSHDDGEGHGYVMANSFSALLNNWTKIGCVGAEDWQWLPFCENNSDGIDPDCPNAKRWLETIGIK